MKRLISEIGQTSLFYWNDPPASFTCVATLLTSNVVLIALARFGARGAPEDRWVTSVAELVGFLILGMACIGALLRPGSRMPGDAYNLARCICIVWLLSLILFTPALSSQVRDALDWVSPAALAAAITGAATCLFAFYSLFQPKNRPISKKTLIIPALFVALVTWFFFWFVILDQDADQSWQDIAAIFTKHKG
jgi:hypothetical protein